MRKTSGNRKDWDTTPHLVINFGGYTTTLDWGASHKLFKKCGGLDMEYIKSVLERTIRNGMHLNEGESAAKGTWKVLDDWIDKGSQLAGGDIVVEVNIRVMNGKRKII